jgi:urea carboxylase-associated protein 2
MSNAMSEATATTDTPLWEELVPGGGHWSAVLRRGTLLRITDLQGGANVAMTFFNQDEKLERYNMADTLKAQHTACLTTGHVCYSDMGRILCSITGDTCGWHDPIGGISDAHTVEKRYGVARFQEHRNSMYRNARDGLLVELGKYGLGRRDLTATVNLFSKITVDESGKMIFHPDNSAAGDYVDLRFEMNTLVALSTSQHPLDPNPEYAPKRIRLTALHAEPVAADDVCRTYCPENGRGFENTERLFR